MDFNPSSFLKTLEKCQIRYEFPFAFVLHNFAGQDRNVIMRKTEDETGEIYYDTDDLIFSGEQHNDFINIYNWVFEVIKELKREYDFRYPSLNESTHYGSVPNDGKTL